jgi:hypothetical protein
MSLAEIERFIAELRSGKRRFQAAGDHRVDAFVALAASKGYAFTIEDVKAHVKARFDNWGMTLSAANLDRAIADYFLRFDRSQWTFFLAKES